MNVFQQLLKIKDLGGTVYIRLEHTLLIAFKLRLIGTIIYPVMRCFLLLSPETGESTVFYPLTFG